MQIAFKPVSFGRQHPANSLWASTMEWNQLWTPNTALPLILVKGVLVYIALCLVLRVAPKRQIGSLTPSEVLLVVMIGGLGIHAVAADAHSVPDVLLLAGTLVLCGVGMNWLACRFPWLRNFLQEPPTQLVRNGKLLHGNLRQELLTEEELMGHIRRSGFNRLADVREAHVEVNGEISVVGDPTGAEGSESLKR